MKRTSLKVIFSIFAMILLFSSCLGDGDSSVTRTGDFAYIGENMGQKYAATSLGQIISPEIDNLEKDQCYSLNYKIITSASGTSGYYNAQDVVPQNDGYPIEVSPFLDAAVPVQTSDSIVPNSFGVNSVGWDPTDYFGNRWLFYYNCSVKDKEGVVARFYYDPNNQKENGENLVGNKVIIDVRFEKTNPQAGTGTQAPKTFTSVCNLNRLKLTRIPNPSAEDVQGNDTYIYLPIKFRFWLSNSDKPVYIGNWQIINSTTSATAYFLAYTK